MMNPVQIDRILTNLVPHLNDIPDVAKQALIETWDEDGFDIVNPPTIDMESGTWTYHDIEDVLEWKTTLKTFGDAERYIKAVILSFIVECKEDYSMRKFFDVTFDQLSISPYSLLYEGDKIYYSHGFQTYRQGLQTLVASEFKQKWKKPVYKLRFSHSGFGTKFYGNQTMFTAIKNYIMGSTEDTPMRIIKAEDYEFNEAKDTLGGGITYITRYSDCDMPQSMQTVCRGLVGTEFYVIYQPKPPMMWEEYKAALVQRGLPQSYADRISQKQRDQLVNFGRILTPCLSYDRKWEFEWKGCHPDHCYLGLLEIKLEPLELSQPARKRRRGPLGQLCQHQRALAEIAPAYFCCEHDIVDCSDQKKSVRPPKYVTKKDSPARRWDDKTLLWTGKAKYYRTWFYEAKKSCCGTIRYIPEGKMCQMGYGHRRRLYGILHKVMPAREPTCLKTIFTAGI
jgi:hypothetical protein